MSANEQFFVGAQTVVTEFVTTQNEACHLYPPTKFTQAQIENHNRFNRDRSNSSFQFYPGWMRLMFTCVLWR